MSTQAGNFVPEQFKTLYELESANFWFRARNSLILWALERYCPAARRMLEIGCGTGFVLSAIEAAHPQWDLTGSELLAEGAFYAAQRLKRAEVIQMNALHVPFADEFDAVGAFDVIEHVDDDEGVLREARKALREGGALLVTVPQHAGLWSAADEFARHKRRYSRAELLAKLVRTGFRPAFCSSFVSLLYPAMLLSRAKRKRIEAFDPMDEFRIGPLANWALEKIMTLERGLIRAGVRFAFGGSLLAVAYENRTGSSR